jgi:hypothetical protein
LLELRNAALEQERPDLIPVDLARREELAKRIPGGVWECWQELDSTRQVGMGAASGILPSEFESWCRLRGMRIGTRRIWWELISAMEREFRNFQAKQSKSRESK